MTTRRQLLIAFAGGALAAPLGSFAQEHTARISRIGFLGAASAAGYAREVEALRAGLREFGYVEGKNLIIEFRWAEGSYDRLPELAGELVRLKVDVIVTHARPGTLAAKQATTTIPIVVAATGDAVATGLVASEARPGGNVTGLSSFSAEIGAKRLELLKEAFPRIRRVAVLWNSASGGAVLRAMEAVAGSLKVELRTFGVLSPSEFDGAFAAMSKLRVEAVAINDDAMLNANAGAVAGLAARHRIPSIGIIETAEAGGLMAYGTDRLAMFRRAAVFVHKILKGAKPGDLPVERATTFELVINQKAAKALGVTIPQSLFMRAVRVLE